MAPQVSVEAVLAADPRLIVTAEPGGSTSQALVAWQRFPTLTATRHRQFLTLDADRINRHGPRLADEIAVLCAAIERTRTTTIN
jgi:ABC-type hemin transport system substrate-binding protein